MIEEELLDMFREQYNITLLPPKEKLNVVRLLRDRESGFLTSRLKPNNVFTEDNCQYFPRQFFRSLRCIQSFTCSSLFEEHQNSIQSVDFDYTGELICSTGMDLKVCIWSVKQNSLEYIYSSGHDYNVSKAKWTVDRKSIATCSEDDTVRIAELCPTAVTESRLVCKHEDSVKDFTFAEPNLILSGGKDASVKQTDLRENCPASLLLQLRKRNNPIPILSIDCNMLLRPNLFAISGRGATVLLFDRRFLSRNRPVPYSIFRPRKPLTHKRISVPSVAFCPNATRLLAAYNNGTVFVFNTNQNCIERQLVGHQCRAITNQCCWFGTEYVFCTSYNGYIYAWDSDSGNVVYFQKADLNDSVNAITIHPNEPIMVTGGSDCRIKVWSPAEIHSFDYKFVRKKVISNLREKQVYDFYCQFFQESEELDSLSSIKRLFEKVYTDVSDDELEETDEIGCVSF